MRESPSFFFAEYFFCGMMSPYGRTKKRMHGLQGYQERRDFFCRHHGGNFWYDIPWFLGQKGHLLSRKIILLAA